MNSNALSALREVETIVRHVKYCTPIYILILIKANISLDTFSDIPVLWEIYT